MSRSTSAVMVNCTLTKTPWYVSKSFSPAEGEGFVVVRLEERLPLDTAVSPTPTPTPNRLGRVTLDRSERELEGELGQPVGQLRWAWLGLGLGLALGLGLGLGLGVGGWGWRGLELGQLRRGLRL